MSDSKERILSRLRNSKRNTSGAIPEYELSEIFKTEYEDLTSVFKSEIEKISGNCIICESEESLTASIKKILEDRLIKKPYCIEKNIQTILQKNNIDFSDLPEYYSHKASITSCEFLSARTGSVVVSSVQMKSRNIHAFPDFHIVIAKESQIYPDLNLGLANLSKNIPSLITVISGPSRTADIEKTLILGAHGPKEIHVLILKNE